MTHHTIHPAIAGIAIVIGGTNYGWTLEREQSFAVLDAFYAMGGRMIDTAEGYSNWVPGNKGGESETIIGEWIAARGNRAELRIASKVNMEGAAGGLSQRRIESALTASLDRLQTDYLDLYYAHRDDPATPQAEVAASLGALVASGRVRSLGASNFTAARLEGAIAAAEELGVVGYTAFQDEYNLVRRAHYESDLVPAARAHGLVGFPYSGLAAGYLTGRYRSPADFARGRSGPDMPRYHSAEGQALLAAMDAIAAETGASLSTIALAWLATRDGVAAPITSASSTAQLQELVAATRLELSAEQLAALDEASRGAG